MLVYFLLPTCQNVNDPHTIFPLQVALGNSKIDVKHGDEDHLDDDINSLKILGLHGPDTDFDARLPFGKIYFPSDSQHAAIKECLEYDTV